MIMEKLSTSVDPKPHFHFSGWEISHTHNAKITSGSSSVRDNASVLYIDDLETPEMILARGHTYNFEVTLSSDSKFFISKSLIGDNSFTHEYVQGVTNSRVSNGTLVFVVPADAPDVLYYSTSNEQMPGGKFR